MELKKRHVALPVLGLAASLSLAGCSSFDDQSNDDVVYCVDQSNHVVDQQRCDDDNSSNSGLFYYLIGRYSAGLQPGSYVDPRLSSYQRFRSNDTAARENAGLPRTGRVSTGKSVSGSSGGFSGSKSGSGSKGGTAGKGGSSGGFGGTSGGFGG